MDGSKKKSSIRITPPPHPPGKHLSIPFHPFHFHHPSTNPPHNIRLHPPPSLSLSLSRPPSLVQFGFVPRIRFILPLCDRQTHCPKRRASFPLSFNLPLDLFLSFTLPTASPPDERNGPRAPGHQLVHSTARAIAVLTSKGGFFRVCLPGGRG